MSNELIFIITVIIYLGSVLLLYKIFGKNGLYIFAVFATILGNIAVCKCTDIFSIATTAGNVLYASTFLVTDILSEKYGKKAASKAVAYSFSIMILWLIGTQLILLFTPNANDYINDSLKIVFGLVFRVTAGSLLGFICSQSIDVFIYHFIWEKTGNSRKLLWLRNNGSTLTSQLIDTVIFMTVAFWGTYPVDVFLSIIVIDLFLYVPDKKLVESKSLKLYLFSFRDHGDFHEDVVNTIMNDLIKLLEPKYIEVWGRFLPRGGLSIDPYCNYGKRGYPLGAGCMGKTEKP